MFSCLRILIFVGDGAEFDYSVDVLVNLDLNVLEFLRRFQYGLYVIIFTRYCLLKFVLLDSFYHEKVQVMGFVGMGNWEQVHTFAAVCKFWRHSSLPHMYKTGKVPRDGGVERRLNIGAFLRFLQTEHFRNAQCIFIPCGKTKGLFVNDIKQACPSVQTIVHSKWLMMCVLVLRL